MELDTYIALHIETFDGKRDEADVFNEAIAALRAAGFRVKAASALRTRAIQDAIYGD